MDPSDPKTHPIATQAKNNDATDAAATSKSALKKAAKLAKFADKQKKKEDAAAAAAAQAKPEESGEKALSKTQLKKKEMKELKESKEKKEIFIPETTPGEKKILTDEMLAGYDPSLVEKSWYEWWEKKGYFKPELGRNKPLTISDKGTFVIVMPPPNVTGSLHLGHALGFSIQDSLIRYNRMLGKTVIFAPGCDHAGIATQVVVEKKILRETNKTRHDLGREAFLDEIWKWKHEKGDYIYKQIKILNVSCDWDRPTFTMEPKMVEATNEAFCRLYESGKIKRASRLVNWCSILNSAISDIEVDYLEVNGTTEVSIPGLDGQKVQVGALTHFAYKVDASKTDEEIVVATTRLETMFGDTAVAVHPNDDRYKHLHGKFLVHPFSSRKIPIILDSVDVDPTFGTGAVKITPAHDFNDFNIGNRHNLELITILNEDGTLNEHAGEFQGMHRLVCRSKLTEKLKELGLYRGLSSNPMKVPICSRTKDFIEPLLKSQWWVNCREMAEKASAAIHTKELDIFPSSHEKTWFRWMGPDLKDWCISRQLWWGHRVPAWYPIINGAVKTEEWIVARNEEDARKKALEIYQLSETDALELRRDEDVLDTWFSASIFPFGIFSWPTPSEDLGKLYPGTLLETGHDILFFWVARMVMMGLELTGKLPFKTVFLHSLVRDAHGRKMSKSLGNVIDPLDVIYGITLDELIAKMKSGNLDAKEQARAEDGIRKDYPEGILQCGSDALRFTLLSYTASGRDINLDVQRVVSVRHFCNKLWNAMRFALTQLGSSFTPLDSQMKPSELSSRLDISLVHKWILSRLYNMVKQVSEHLRDYHFQLLTLAITSFWQLEFCDIYLEVTKPIFHGNNEADKEMARETLYTCLDVGLRVLAPFMPFLAEELYQRIPSRSSEQHESSIIAPFPEFTSEAEQYLNSAVEATLSSAIDVIRAARALRQEYLPLNVKPESYLTCTNENDASEMESLTSMILYLGGLTSLNLLVNQPPPSDLGCVISPVGDKFELSIPLRGLVDPAREIAKIEKRVALITGILGKLTAITSDLNYLQKSSEDVRLKNKEKAQTLTGELELLEKTKAMYLSL